MTAKELQAHILQFCKANYNEANVIKYSNYFKGEYNAWGLTSPQIREKVKEMLKANQLSLNVLIDAIPLIMKNGKHEELTIAILLLEGFAKNFSKKTFFETTKWYARSIDNWALADMMGMFILSRFLKQAIIIPDDFKPWITSPYKFQRRCVPVALIKILKTKKDFSELFALIEPLMIDSEREVHQGCGWFLREAWKIKREDTEKFLSKWKDKSPRLIMQYACEKMTVEEKQRFKKAKTTQ